MASGKRASMREGPLAALFRKTEEDAPAADRPAGGRGMGKRSSRSCKRRSSGSGNPLMA